MMLTDDCLFDHWVNEKVEMEDVLGKAHDPDSLAKRIATARREMEEGVTAGLKTIWTKMTIDTMAAAGVSERVSN